ncbi:MAG: TetR/AcrR family transcriptional regulator [Oleispira sp.]
MARPQVFNQQQVMAKAVECFWLKGYSETSLADLLTAMGISRSTFYNNFGDKRQLFRLCLQAYGQQTQHIIAMTLLSNKFSGLESIRQFLHLVLLAPTEEFSSRGCLLVNTLAETARVDDELNQLAKQLMQSVKLAFIQQLQKEFDQAASIRHGEWLFTQLLGWRLQTQLGIAKNILEEQIDWSLLQLKQPMK